mgnify:CR=1 FL=1
MEFFLDSFLAFIIWTSAGILVGTALGGIIGKIKNNIKPVTKSFVRFFGAIGVTLGLTSFCSFFYLGTSGHGYVAFSISDYILGASLFLVSSIPIYFLWFYRSE